MIPCCSRAGQSSRPRRGRPPAVRWSRGWLGGPDRPVEYLITRGLLSRRAVLVAVLRALLGVATRILPAVHLHLRALAVIDPVPANASTTRAPSDLALAASCFSNLPTRDALEALANCACRHIVARRREWFYPRPALLWRRSVPRSRGLRQVFALSPVVARWASRACSRPRSASSRRADRRPRSRRGRLARGARRGDTANRVVSVARIPVLAAIALAVGPRSGPRAFQYVTLRTPFSSAHSVTNCLARRHCSSGAAGLRRVTDAVASRGGSSTSGAVSCSVYLLHAVTGALVVTFRARGDMAPAGGRRGAARGRNRARGDRGASAWSSACLPFTPADKGASERLDPARPRRGPRGRRRALWGGHGRRRRGR